MKMMDCVEVVTEKQSYTREGVHKGMQGWICLEQRTPGYWLVNFPQYGGMDPKINERIKAQFENSGDSSKSLAEGADDISGYLI